MDPDLAHRTFKNRPKGVSGSQNIGIEDSLPPLHLGPLFVKILPNLEESVQITLAARLAALDGDAKIREGRRINYFRQH
jgi:hypothetical protein